MASPMQLKAANLDLQKRIQRAIEDLEEAKAGLAAATSKDELELIANQFGFLLKNDHPDHIHISMIELAQHTPKP